MAPTPHLLPRMCCNAINEWKEKTEGKERKESFHSIPFLADKEDGVGGRTGFNGGTSNIGKFNIKLFN